MKKYLPLRPYFKQKDMALFQPSVTLSQSLDGKTLVLSDTSNYGAGNSEGVTLGNIVNRAYVITNGDNEAVLSGVFSAGQLTKTVTLTKDAYLNTALSFTLASSAVRTGTNDYLAENFYNSAMIVKAKKLTCDCGCDKNLCSDTMKALLAKEASEFYFAYGYATNSQTLIEAANSLIGN